MRHISSVYDLYEEPQSQQDPAAGVRDSLIGLGEADPENDAPALQWTPELTLMLAILEDAIACYRRALKRPRQNPEILARQAEFWIRLDDWESPFSFNNICEALRLEPVATRQRILGSR